MKQWKEHALGINFWKTETGEITLIENDEVVATEQETAFLSNIVTHLKIPKYANYDSIASNVSDLYDEQDNQKLDGHFE